MRCRGTEWQLRTTEANLLKWAQKPPTAATQQKTLKNLFALIAREALAGNESNAFKAVDLLQHAYGQGLMRTDEPVHITTLVSSLLHQDKPGLAAAVLDTYRGLRRLEQVSMIAEQLQTVGVLAIRAKQNFVAAKATDILFAVLERTDVTADRQAVASALGMMKILGKHALKRDDTDYYRELITRLCAFLAADPQPAVQPQALAELVSLWLQVIVSKQNETALQLLTDNVLQLNEAKLLNQELLCHLLPDWQDIAGIASLNPYSTMAPTVIRSMVALAVSSGNISLWNVTTDGIAKTVRLITGQYSVQQAFPLLQPLLDESRKMLSAELRFDVASPVSAFRQQALCSVLRETLSVAEFAARTRISASPYDIFAEFFACWSAAYSADFHVKSTKRLFQLLIAFWQKNMSQQAKKQIPANAELLEPVLLNEMDVNKLSFMK